MQKPDFCINKNCEYHKKELKKKHWWTRFGHYESVCRGRIQRFRCKKCGKTFSAQTYDIDYYAKRIISYKRIMKYLSCSMSLSSTARMFKASVETISNRIERLARQAVVYHEYLKGHIKLNEDLTSDGFESFVQSQYFPNNIHFLGGKDSQYLYFMNYVLLKRKGRMTDYQKKKAKKLYNGVYFPKGALSKSFSQVIDEFFMLSGTSSKHVSLYTDMKPEYQTAFRNHPLYKENKGVSHIAIHSKKNRTISDENFTNEYLDRETRKDQANHRRETKCFSRNACSCMNRMNVYFFSHNYIKDYRVKNKEYKGISHAEVAGVPRKVIKAVLKKIFKKRVFLSLENVCSFGLDLWNKNILTPLKNKKDYVPKYAFM